MKLIVKGMRRLVVIALSLSVIACSDNPDVVEVPTSEEPLFDKISLDVYKSPTCGCCGKWVKHAEASGFEATLLHPTDLNKLKADKGILPRFRSCHTAVSPDGYVFEGHIPANVIKRFLANPPADSIGLSVPGMPIGSPGMEMGSRQDEYDVLLLSKNGSDTVFEHIDGKR